jgi:hypothetical protein
MGRVLVENVDALALYFFRPAGQQMLQRLQRLNAGFIEIY